MAKKREEYDYEAHDDMNTLMRAEEIKKDNGRMKRAQAKAHEHSQKMAEVAHRAGQLAKSGHISEKQMAKLKKTGKIASGKEGDTGSSQTMRGVTSR